MASCERLSYLFENLPNRDSDAKLQLLL